MSNPLHWDVLVSDEVPVVTRDLSRIEPRHKDGMDLGARHDRITEAKHRCRRAQKAGPGGRASVVVETRQYIRDFDRIAADTRTAKDLYNEMLALYPDRVNPGALWSSARGVKG